MSYQVNFTETTNPAKPAITVQDQQLNTETDLTFVGKNYAGYAPIVAENFLHLLENFANPTAPLKPVQGQLWYDSSPGVNLLKIFDSTQWVSAGAIKKATKTEISQSIASNNVGDLWVDVSSRQLNLWSGSSWLLVGPQFSEGAKTGPVVETIVDTNNVDNNVIVMYADNFRVAVVSKSAFTPKQNIPGFTSIGQGINLSSIDVTSTTAPTKFWGVASTADALKVNGVDISAANFLRSDTTSTTNNSINIRSNGGLVLGSDLSFSITRDTNSTIFYSKTSGNTIDFKLNNAGNNSTALHINSDFKVGIGPNNTNPLEALDVLGNISLSGDIFVQGDSDSTNLGTGAIQTDGGLSVNKRSTFGGDITSYGKIFLNYLDNDSNPISTSIILPGSDSANNLYDIGSTTRKFRNIYASNFVGNFNGAFTGTLTGNISGSAARLASPTAFSIIGDVNSDIINFNGQSSLGTATFNTVVSQNIIERKQEATVDDSVDGEPNSLGTDEMLIYRPTKGLRKVSKNTFVGNIATVPIGVIFPFAGSTIPPGYLLCDGSEVSIGQYPLLFGVISYLYRPAALLLGKSTFALPDLRGRFALGRDNMDNGNQVTSKTSPPPPADQVLIDAGGGSANRVTDIVADTLGAGTDIGEFRSIAVRNLPDHQHELRSDTGEYFAVGRPGVADSNAVSAANSALPGLGVAVPNTGNILTNGTTGNALPTMNPYMTVNYIIFTGATQ
jgi:microcystin-dependent protein